MATFLLVHGTFDSSAEWTQCGSRFRNKIEETFRVNGEMVRFIKVKWSGKNGFDDRWDAARNIATEVDKIRLVNPGEIFI